MDRHDNHWSIAWTAGRKDVEENFAIRGLQSAETKFAKYVLICEAIGRRWKSRLSLLVKLELVCLSVISILQIM